MFKGHEFVKLLNDNWVLDITEFKGYHIKTKKNGEVSEYKLAFIVSIENGEAVFDKREKIPVKVLKEAKHFTEEYSKIGVDT